jgi:hypothetical protein
MHWGKSRRARGASQGRADRKARLGQGGGDDPNSQGAGQDGGGDPNNQAAGQDTGGDPNNRGAGQDGGGAITSKAVSSRCCYLLTAAQPMQQLGDAGSVVYDA